MRKLKFLGIEWSKDDLEILADVIEEGMEVIVHDEDKVKFQKAIDNIKEILA